MSQKENPSTRRRRGRFTLVELLIVIGIIAILAALLLPALKSCKDKAYEMKCSSNLRQSGFCLNSYVDDNGGYFTSYTGYGSYMILLLPYIQPRFGTNLYAYYIQYGNSMIYHCPNATGDDSWSGSAYSYGQNEHMNSYDSSSAWYVQKMSKLVSPSKACYHADSSIPSVYSSAHFSFRHRTKAVFVYADSHCASITHDNAMVEMASSGIEAWYGRPSL